MSHTNIKLYGTNWCSDCKRSKKFLGEQRVHYDFINIEEDKEGQAYVQKVLGYAAGYRASTAAATSTATAAVPATTTPVSAASLLATASDTTSSSGSLDYSTL